MNDISILAGFVFLVAIFMLIKGVRKHLDFEHCIAYSILFFIFSGLIFIIDLKNHSKIGAPKRWDSSDSGNFFLVEGNVSFDKIDSGPDCLILRKLKMDGVTAEPSWDKFFYMRNTPDKFNIGDIVIGKTLGNEVVPEKTCFNLTNLHSGGIVLKKPRL